MIIGIILDVLLALLLISCIKKQFRQIKKSFFSNFKEVEGIVVDIKEHKGSGSTTYSSIIEFFVNGQPYRYVEKVSDVSTEKIGTKIKIKYNPYDPTDCVKKYCFDYVGPIIIIAIFIVVLGFIF